MSGQGDLHSLLASLAPELVPGSFGFCTLALGKTVPPGLVPWAIITEAEGLTIIARHQDLVDAGLPRGDAFSCITLRVNSSLLAVGLTAAVSTALAKEAIPANMVAGYHHDHIFVPATMADHALEILHGLSQLAQGR